ncbi:MAG: type 4a pilus biogenesis protein PilO [Nitrospinae bacterium]|nr:type 4a pilus biogenesis protein PilO [Nitrospinota bacterium]
MDLDKLFEKIPYERLYPIKPWQRMGALAAVALSLFVAIYFTLIQGQFGQIAQLENDLTEIKRKIDENLKHIQKQGKLKEMIAQLNGDLELAKRQLPTEQEIPELLEQISNLGTQFGLEFLTFRPNAEVRKDFYAEVPVTLKITGGFHDTLKFFDEISHLPRIVTINNLGMRTEAPKAKGTAPSGGKSNELQVECQAVTYRYIEGSEKIGNAAEDPTNAEKPKR